MPSLKSFLAKFSAQSCYQSLRNGLRTQLKLKNSVLKAYYQAEKPIFGKDHDFQNIKIIEDFKNQVPVRDYEALKSLY